VSGTQCSTSLRPLGRDAQLGWRQVESGSPADESGKFKVGDVILQVGVRRVVGLALSDVNLLLAGPLGSEVRCYVCPIFQAIILCQTMTISHCALLPLWHRACKGRDQRSTTLIATCAREIEQQRDKTRSERVLFLMDPLAGYQANKSLIKDCKRWCRRTACSKWGRGRGFSSV
jgi:hypothetical protein